MNNVYIVGGSTTKFGELWNISPKDMVRDVVWDLLDNTKTKLNYIEAIFVGNMLSGIFGGQENLGAFIASALNLNVPSFKIEGACASGGLAFYNAVNSLKGGEFNQVLVLGVEKMTDHRPEQVATGLMAAGSDIERMSGITFPGLYALMAQKHMEIYGTTVEQLAAVAVKNHYHGSLNPKAQFQNKITIEKVLQSPRIADPLKLLDCSPISDGASAVLISTKKTTNAIKLIGSGVATDTLNIMDRKSLISLSATVTAGKKAFTQAKIKPLQVDVAEVHDCFTIAEILALEDLGFYQKGKAGPAILAGETTLGKEGLTVNTSGGLKACGHPVGATGIKQIVEIVEQLQGQCGKRQVKNAQHGLTHNVGGSGAVAVVNIFEN